MYNLAKHILFLIGLSVIVFNGTDAHAQTLSNRKIKKFVKKGRKAYRKEEYWKAKSYYDKVTAANTDKAQYWFETGLAYYDSQVKREQASVYFEKALELSTTDTIPEIFYYAAKTYHFRGEFEKAIEFYNIFLNKITDNKRGQEIRQEVIREIEICNNGIDLRDVHLYDVQGIIRMNENINSPYMDYSPVIANDERLILFCSRRPPGKKQHVDGLYFEDIFYSTKDADGNWDEANIIDKSSGYISKEINEGKEHEAPISLSPDGNTLYIYKRNSIWKSQKGDDGKWSIPMRMNQNVNIGEANPSIFITPDETEMFIVATGVKDGYGDRDIYYSQKDESGRWMKPVNMGEKINTPYKEDAPYLSKDGKSLYFASQGHNSMGGFDIFRTVRGEDGEWSEPKNIGTPVNSAGDDIYYVENEEGTLAYYSSMRPGSYGYLDIYTAKYDCKNIPTTEVKGYAVYADNHLPVNGVIKVTDTDSGEEMGTFEIDPKTGKYQMVLPPDHNYEMELFVAQAGYTQDRPHTERFFIPKQCEAYNLFQQIQIEQNKDEEGNLISQAATFQHALFDVDLELKKIFELDDFEYHESENPHVGGISGNLAHSEKTDGEEIEVMLLNDQNQIVRVTRTDDDGDFAFERLDTTQAYKVLVNEEDAIASYNKGEDSHPSEFYMQGKLQNYVERDNIPRVDATIYMATPDKILTDMSVTDTDGEFEFKNPTTPLAVIEELNDNTTITYNMDDSDSEILYSALLTTIDPTDERLVYTERMDLVELKELTETDETMREFANILFDFDKFFLRQKSEDVLESLYLFMNENPSVHVKLDGFTDWIGTEEYNEVLSKKRALSAHKYLIDKGIQPDRIHNAWFGEADPVAPNAYADGKDDPAGRQLNRRVEIKVEIPEMADLYLSL